MNNYLEELKSLISNLEQNNSFINCIFVNNLDFEEYIKPTLNKAAKVNDPNRSYEANFYFYGVRIIPSINVSRGKWVEADEDIFSNFTKNKIIGFKSDAFDKVFGTPNPVNLIDLPDNPTVNMNQDSINNRREAFVEWMTRGNTIHENKKNEK